MRKLIEPQNFTKKHTFCNSGLTKTSPDGVLFTLSAGKFNLWASSDLTFTKNTVNLKKFQLNHINCKINVIMFSLHDRIYTNVQ